jgi:DNA-binding MarR family transcriptional regulator
MSETKGQDGWVHDLTAELEEIRAGLTRELPGFDWEAPVLQGRIGALANLSAAFTKATLVRFGLTLVEQQVLGILRAGTVDTPGALARATHQSAAGMTRTLDRLEGRGLLRRKAHSSDRRSVAVVLTAKGRTQADRKLIAEATAWETALDGMTRAELDAINNSLDTLMRRLSVATRAIAERS